MTVEKVWYIPSFGSLVLQISPTSSSSFLRPGSKFVGTQQSDRQVYNVQVEIKYVDMEESFLCGYLRIQGWSPFCCVSTAGIADSAQA